MDRAQTRADSLSPQVQDFVKALGEDLIITARFPEGTVEITQFEAVKKAAGDD